jgi:hypothetical protein
MQTRFSRAALAGAALVALTLGLATSAATSAAAVPVPVPFVDACAEKATAHFAPLAAACAKAKACLASVPAPVPTVCTVRAQQSVETLRGCVPCRGAMAELEKQVVAFKNLSPAKPPPAPPASSVAPPAPPAPTVAPPAPPPAVGAPRVVPGVPADCSANLPQGDLKNLVDDSSWGYCAADKADCPCSYKPCVIGMNDTKVSVVEPSVPDANNPGWSKTKVKNVQGANEWLYCTVRSCQIAATIKNQDETLLRCWSKPLPP